MDALLDRLWELANEDDDPRRNERVTEARALWRALEVLLTSLKPQELSVGDGTFTKTLACVRSVLSDASYWALPTAAGDGSDDSFMTVFVCVNRVLLKVSSRGEQEREALVRDGVADLIVRCGESDQQVSTLSAFEAAAALQTLQSLATDSKNRPSLQVSHTIRLCISVMQKHATVFAVQLRACQFLHQMALEEDSKERILRHGGLQTVTSALSVFVEEAEFVVTALDVLFFLCVELEYRDVAVQSVPSRTATTAVFQSVVNAVLYAMRGLQSVELVQANGVAVLNSMVMHPPVKQTLCSRNVWEIAENGLSTTATDDVACDFVELLETLLQDPITCETLRQMLSNSSQAHGVTQISFKNQVEALHHSQVASIENEARMVFVAARLQSLLDTKSLEATPKPQNDISVSTNDDYNGYEEFMYSHMHRTMPYHTSAHTDDDSGDELPVDSDGSPAYMNDLQNEDGDGLLLSEGTGYFDRFLQVTQASSANAKPELFDAEAGSEDDLDALCKNPNGARVCAKVHLTPTRELLHAISQDPEPATTKSGSGAPRTEGMNWQALPKSNTIQTVPHFDTSYKEAENWQVLYEASAREVDRVRMASRELENRYCIVLRRAKEQTKLLVLQNARLSGHADEHQQILRRMRSLEALLAEADRRCQVERALRSAEAAQCEQLSLALNESMREAKSLAAQQSSSTRELQQKEAMRTEYLMRTRESKHEKQLAEVERDNALLQIEILKHEKTEWLLQLEDCRREGLEALSMREEDTDARRRGVFSELAKVAALHQGAYRSNIHPSMKGISRRNSLPSETLTGHLSEPLNSTTPVPVLHRPTSVHPIQTCVETFLNDDPNSIGTAEIQSCLNSLFQSLDITVESGHEVGVHVSIVRRFFMESGLVQAPHLLPADVDVVLAGVLAQSQLNRKTTLVRKDFTTIGQQTWSPPHGWAKTTKKTTPSKSMNLAGDTTRYRFFNMDAFNEAVTLIGMRRFPRSDLLRVLQTVVALYLRPYIRQQLTLCQSSTNQRSRSPSSCGVRRRASVGSPSQVFSRAMKSILTGLALHLGHGNENELLRNSKSSGVQDGETRWHLYPPPSIGCSHKREDVVYSMLEMNGVLSREQRPLGAICEFYSSQHFPNATATAAISTTKTELFGLSFDLVLSFAIDFELIPSFMDRVSLKRLHTEVAGLLKVYFAIHDKDPPSGADAETLKKVGFGMILARLALELFSSKPGYETPEQQITGLLQWLDNSNGREKIMRKADIPLVIRFTRQLYSGKAK